VGVKLGSRPEESVEELLILLVAKFLSSTKAGTEVVLKPITGDETSNINLVRRGLPGLTGRNM
jgi:hypothetical protein